MKTLDEVIKAYEICMSCTDDDDDCKGCPYADDGEPKCYGADKKDALHYLKAFRDAKYALEAEKDRYAEAVRNCERAENKYRKERE